MSYFISVIYLLCIFSSFVSSIFLRISNNGPIVRGGTITFTAELYSDDGTVPPPASYKFEWLDNAIPAHARTFESDSPVSTWNVTYGWDYPPGPYEVQVYISKYILVVYYPITSRRSIFNISELLNGNIDVIQKNQTINEEYVSNAATAQHIVNLTQPDANFLKSNATSVITYWFVDCVYYGPTDNFKFDYNYTVPDKEHTVEALIVAGYEPITTPAPSTTTSTTTATTSVHTTPTTATPTTKKSSPTLTPINKTAIASEVTGNTYSHSVNLISSKRQKRAASYNNGTIMMKVNNTLVPYNGSFPFVCLNNTVAPDPSKTYGYFSKTVQVRAPVSNLTVTGNNWLQHGELLNLSVKCQGSSSFSYCVTVHGGKYNVTGNETCDVMNKNVQCNFQIQRYLRESTLHTIVIIIANDVSKIVSPVTITVYKVQKQAQLSVIVVPVAFTLVAVVLVIFGVAYYIQSRSRFIVEVADFNFGHTYSDLEYKTFRERLRDSIVNAFTKAPTPSSSEVPVWPPGKRYGSMT